VQHDPVLVLQFLANRRLSAQELADAFGVSRATYYSGLKDRTLFSATNLIRAARSLGINPVEVLLRFEVLAVSEVAEFAAAQQRAAAAAAELVGWPSAWTPQPDPRDA